MARADSVPWHAQWICTTPRAGPATLPSPLDPEHAGGRSSPQLPWQCCFPFCTDCCHGLPLCHPVWSLLAGSVTVSLPFGLSVVFLSAANPTVTAGRTAAGRMAGVAAATPEPAENSVGRPGKSGLYSRVDSVMAGYGMCGHALESWIWSSSAHTAVSSHWPCPRCRA